MTAQGDLFGAAEPAPAATEMVLREERRFGRFDAKSGYGFPNSYSRKLSGERLRHYEIGYREAAE